MKKVIDRVTVTGADDSNGVEDLVEIQKMYPFVEWGILLSKHSEGSYRFPSAEWIEGLKPVADKLTLSGHLCGRWVRDICDGHNTVYEDRPLFTGLFQRYQLNFHAYQHRIKDEAAFVGAARSLCAKQVIFQFDDVNNKLLGKARAKGIDAAPLFDTSGGAGVLPGEWPEALDVYSGYAGGLSPENLPEQMEAITEKCGDGPIWIDAETWLRSAQDSIFDLDKVCKFLEQAKPFMVGE
jgi:phosphoribosylanthranilate isomerase